MLNGNSRQEVPTAESPAEKDSARPYDTRTSGEAPFPVLLRGIRGGKGPLDRQAAQVILTPAGQATSR